MKKSKGPIITHYNSDGSIKNRWESVKEWQEWKKKQKR